MRVATRRAAQILSWATIVTVAMAILLAVIVPRVSGATPYTVITGSMTPALPPGTLVVMRPVAESEIGIGDVITYQLVSGKSAVVTHRVVGMSTSLAGELRLVTKGDASGTVDAEPVRSVQVRGKLWYSVPYLGHMNRLIGAHHRQLAVYGVTTLLLGYSGYMFASSLRQRQAKNASAEKGATS